MGLETVEIVVWAEEEFEISIPDEEIRNIYTIGEFAKYIAEKVNSSNCDSITYQDTLPKIIDLLVDNYGVERCKINTSSKFVQDLGLD